MGALYKQRIIRIEEDGLYLTNFVSVNFDKALGLAASLEDDEVVRKFELKK